MAKTPTKQQRLSSAVFRQQLLRYRDCKRVMERVELLTQVTPPNAQKITLAKKWWHLVLNSTCLSSSKRPCPLR
jgi:hypothetical protein